MANAAIHRAPADTPSAAISAFRSVVAAITGNTLELYDFLLYACFAVTIGKLFFPADTPLTSLLLSVGTFGVGFIARPIGALVIGAYADRAGRKPAMTLTISLMALSTALLALAPPYEVIGLFAPALIVMARLVQGFSAGGEMGAATSYILESAPADKRGLYTSWMNGSQGIALILAGSIGFGLSKLLTPESLEAWGWRAAFLFGLLVAPVGFYMRSRLPETFAVRDRASDPNFTLPTIVKGHARLIVLGVLTIMSGAVSFYVISYMTTYAITALKLQTSVSLLAPLISGVAALLGSIAGGLLADRNGRKIVIIVPRIILIIVVLPGFLLLTREPTAEVLFLVTAILMTLHSISGAVMSVLLPEALPAPIRTIGFSFIYTIGVTLFGGPTQFVLAWIIGITGDPISPAYYLVAANLLSVIAMFFLKETKGKALL
jgi:MFS family permease